MDTLLASQQDARSHWKADIEILQQLEDLLNHPKCDRMPNLATSAQTNNGKTRPMKRFLSLHQASVSLAPHDVRRTFAKLAHKGLSLWRCIKLARTTLDTGHDHSRKKLVRRANESRRPVGVFDG